MLRLTDIKNRWRLHRYFNNTDTKLLYCEVPTELLLSRLDKNVFAEASDAIEAGYQYDITEVDKKLKNVHLCAVDQTGNLRTLLKMGYLTDELKSNGQKNPIQLILSSQPGFYKVHPGTVRIIVSSYILEYKTTKLIYCWNKDLEPDTFLLDYLVSVIDSPEEFFKLHPMSTEVRCKKLTNTTKYVDPNRFVNFYGLQLESLKTRYKDFNFNFLTTFDSWKPSLESRVAFKDIVQYENDKCLLAGIEFKKVKDMWVKSS